MICAQKNSFPVDANGKKIVYLTKVGVLKKQINKKEIPLIKELKIIGQINTNDINFLSKLTELEIVDMALANIVECNINEVIPVLTVKKIIDNAESYRDYINKVNIDNFSSENSNVELLVKYTNIVMSNHTIPYLYIKLFPNIEQYKINIDNFINNLTYTGNLPDTLLFAITSFDIPYNIKNEKDAFLEYQTDSPQLLIKEKAILLDKKVKGENCHVICGINRSESLLKNAICLYVSAIKGIPLEKIIIPKNLKYIITEKYGAQINTKSLIIEEGNEPLFIGERAFADSDIKKLEFNRPVSLLSTKKSKWFFEITVS